MRYATKACLAAVLGVVAVSVAQSAAGAPSANTLQFSFKMGVILGGTECPDGTVGWIRRETTACCRLALCR